MVFLPALLMMRAKPTLELTVVDAVGGVGARLGAALEALDRAPLEVRGPDDLDRDEATESARLAVRVLPGEADAEAQRAALDRAVLAGEVDAWIRVAPESLESGEVEYHAESVSNFMTQSRLERALTEVFSFVRLERAGYEPARVVELTRPVELETLKVTEEGTTAEEGMVGFFLAYLLFFMLYLVVAIYGGLVMNGVLEEKTSRIVEVLLATTTSKELLYGKLLGIGLAGLTQLAVWLATLAALPAPSVAGALAFGLGDAMPRIAPAVFLHFLLLFLLGFFLYSSFYAAIGSATNSAQEAQPLTAIVVPFLVGPVLFMPVIINDPDSTMATVLSLVPFFTPLLMMLRIVVKMPPLWQILLGYVLTAGLVWALMSLCARIYRIGILMYGKRPTFAELGRWIRHG
jgi:ABC-2 type transport system permease protein